MSRTPTGESVLSRAVRILDAFGYDDRLTVSQLARRSDLPLPTVSRLVAELRRLGLLQRDEDGAVRIGVRLWELASRSSTPQSLREAALPYMEDLHSAVGQHTQLAVLDGEEVLVVERLTARRAVKHHTRVGGRLPVHASSAGLVLLANAPRDLQERVLAAPLTRYTDHTVTDPQRLRRLLADARRRDLSVCEGHLNVEATSAAVPVRDRDRRVVAALSVIVPNGQEAASAVPALRAAAHGISRALGAPRPQPPPPRQR